MSVQLLDKTRKINKLLHNNNSTKVVFNDICKVMMETLDSNILVISKKGKVLGVSLCPGVEEITADTEAAENNIAQTRPDLTRIFTFSSLDTVIRAALALNGWYTGTNTLYKDRETTYVLILHQSGMNPEDFNRVCNMLSEYGTGKACTAATEAYFKEHGEILIADQALQQLLLLNV